MSSVKLYTTCVKKYILFDILVNSAPLFVICNVKLHSTFFTHCMQLICFCQVAPGQVQVQVFIFLSTF